MDNTMDDLAQDVDWSPREACINLEKATQFITQLLQREISRNQELCALIHRLEEREVESGRSLAEEVESNQQLRLKIDELNKRLKEKDSLLTQANQTLAFLKNEQRDLHQQLQQHRTIQEVNEWLQSEDTQVKVESLQVSPEAQLLEAPVPGIKVEEQQANGENCQSEERTDSRTEINISVAADIKTELIEEEDVAPVFGSETHLPLTDACPISSSSSSEPVHVSRSFSHPLHKDDSSISSQLRLHHFIRTKQTLYYQCNQCSQTFPQLGGLVRHQRIHTGEKSFCCILCGKSFHHEGSLLRHQRAAHTRETPYDSSDPGKSFSQERHQHVHIDQHVLLQSNQQAAHTGEMPYGSGHLSQEGDLATHHHHVHTEGWSTEHTQSNKHLSCVGDVSLVRHGVRTSGQTYNSTQSDESVSLFVPQQQTHTGQRLHPGLQCNRTFSIDGKLRRNHHQRILGPRHRAQRGSSGIGVGFGVGVGVGVGEKRPHQCIQCGRRFTQLRNLRTHQKFHTGERLHGCDQCGKSFTSVGNLRVHQRVHTGERPYSCMQCGRSFTHEGNLKAHQRTHTGEKPYRCARCGRSFTRSTYVKLHQCVDRREGQRQGLDTDQIT